MLLKWAYRSGWMVMVTLLACSKNKPQDEPDKPGTGEVVIKPQTDPELATTIGFFMDNWQPKTFNIPVSFSAAGTVANAATIITIDRSVVLSKVPPTLFGNNANTWMTQMVDQPVLINHLKQNKPGYIRFPGGSISDIFFWNALPGLPPPNAPGTLVNANGESVDAGYWYGRNTAGWTLSVDNYYSMLQQTGNKGFITVNYGYARYGTGTNPVADAAHLAADWVRYDQGRTRYWEIGNENFGSWEAGYRINTANNKDGQPAYGSGALYGTHFKVFADSMRKAAAETGTKIYIGAVLVDLEPAAYETTTFKTWNQGAIPALGNTPDFYVVHNYYTPYHENSSAAVILSSGSTVTRNVMQYVKQQLQTYGVTPKPVAMNEWNIFATGSGQMVSNISGLHALSVLSEMLKQQYGFAARWDLANGWENGNDHGLFSQGDEPDGIPKWTPRPAFYYLYYFQWALGDKTIQAASSDPNIETYASSFSSGQTSVVLINKSTTDLPVEIKIDNFVPGNRYYWYSLHGSTDNGAFSRKVIVNGQAPVLPAGGPENYFNLQPYSALTGNGMKVTVPGRGAVFLVAEKK